jgi:hypothetical protein
VGEIKVVYRIQPIKLKFDTTTAASNEAASGISMYRQKYSGFYSEDYYISITSRKK